MTKREICTTEKSIAYYSGFGGFEIKKVEYGIEDYIYAVSGAWCNKKSYHKLKIYSGNYVKLHGYKIPLDECMRIN